MKPDNNIKEVFVIQGYYNWKDALDNKDRLDAMSVAQFTKEQLRLWKPLPEQPMILANILTICS